uniref:general transcription factor II-I repeat domain-containing protein 2B-like n=1 Tax=Styela clava TaxID=7725 RepID=UPI0019398146|nr:general transcription factor II-I repeat domain-containing protein 2B-like [Styela clava]
MLRRNSNRSFLCRFDELLKEFNDRYQDLEMISETITLVASPHLVETESAPLHVQMEMVRLKNNEQIAKKFKNEKNRLDTWRDAVEYPNLQELARKTIVLFGSTHTCEAAFSRLKFLKNKY